MPKPYSLLRRTWPMMLAGVAHTACIDVDGLVFAAGGEGGSTTSTTGSASTGEGGGGAPTTSTASSMGGAGGGGGPVVSGYAGVVLADGPAVYYRFDETGTAVVADSGPDDHEALALNNGGEVTRGVPGALAGGEGYAIELRGGAIVSLSPNPLGLGESPAYTIEAWVRVPDENDGGVLFWWRASSNPQSGFATYLNSNTIQHKRYDDRGAFEDIYLSPVNLQSSFRHLVVTVDPPSARLYVDGTLATSPSFELAGLILPNHSAPLLVAETGGNGRLIVDEVAYYRSVLSLPRIEAHFRCGRFGECD